MKKKLIKCAKGAVSLFLVVLLLPFTEIATLLISAQRYNASIALLDEVMDSSAISTLSDYDAYVRDRFGLFTISQKKDISENFNSYFNYNKDGLLRNAFSDNLTLTAKGNLSLDDKDIMLAQIKEYNKLNAPIKMINDGFDLSELIKDLEKKLKLSNILDLLNAGADLCDGAIDFEESHQKLVKLSNKIGELNSDYTSKFNNFSVAITTLNNAFKEAGKMAEEAEKLNKELEELNNQLKELEENLKNSSSSSEKDSIQKQIEDLEEDIEEKEKEVQENEEESGEKIKAYNTAKTDYITKRDEYADAHPELASKLGSYRDEMKTALEKLKSVIDSTGEFLVDIGKTAGDVNDLKERNKQIDKELKNYTEDNVDEHYYELVFEREDNDKKIAAYDVAKNGGDGLSNANKEISRLVEEAHEAFDEQAIQNVIDKLGTEETAVRNLTVETAQTKTDGNGYYTVVDDVVLSKQQLDNLSLYLDELSGDIGVSLSDLWEAIKAFLESVFKLKLVYDPALCSKIDANYFASQFGISIDQTASNPMAELIMNICSFISGLIDFVAKTASLDIIGMWKAIKQVFSSGIGVVDSLARTITQVVSNIISYVQDPAKLLLPYYFTQTLPCRTDYRTGKNMTGNPYSKIEYANYGDNGVNGLPVIESVVSLFNIVFNEKEATDKMFCGAELEYLIAGTSSEIKNQSVVFGMLYIIRLLLDIPGWAKATELQTLAAGPHYVIVFLVYLLLEPFLDTVLLVNGEKVSILKAQPFLSVAGMTDFIPKLIKVAKTDDTSSAQMRQKFANLFVKAGNAQDDFDYSYDHEAVITGGGEKPGYFKKLLDLSYKEYLLIIMLLNSSVDKELELYKNLIQMETLAYNTRWRKGSFDLRKAYTQIVCEISGSAKPLLATTFSDSIFRFAREQCRGY